MGLDAYAAFLINCSRLRNDIPDRLHHPLIGYDLDLRHFVAGLATRKNDDLERSAMRIQPTNPWRLFHQFLPGWIADRITSHDLSRARYSPLFKHALEGDMSRR